MIFFKNKSLLSKVQCIQVITLIGAFLGVFLILSTILHNYIHDNHQKYLKQLSHSIKNDINNNILMYKSYLQNISEDEDIKEYNQTFEEARIAHFLLRNKDIFPYLSFIDKSGQEIYKLSNKVLFSHLSNYKTKVFFTKILENPNKVIVSNIEYDSEIKQHVIYFALHKENYFGNEFQGILLASIPIKSFIKTKIIDENIISNILTDTNHIVYSSKKENILFQEKFEENKENLTFRSSIINQKTFLLLDYPHKIIDSHIYDILKMIAIVFLVVLFIAFILVYRENKKMVKPINALIEGIDDVSKGHFSSKIDVPKEQELKLIAKSFNKMIKELQLSQVKVEANQYELEKLNKSLEIEISKQHKNLKDKDKMLFQKAKLASMGEMIDTIVHQWRQPLSIISTIASGTLVKLNYDVSIDKKELLKNSNLTMSQVKHLDETIDEFRHFFREDNNFEVLPIKDSIQSALILINNHLIQNKVTVKLNFEDDLLIELIPNEFKHVLINIINNSIDAFNETSINNPELSINAHKKDTQIELQIVDNAGGIPKEILNKIFLANFTTKDINKGTGIGLYIVKQILRKINATITAKNVQLENNNSGAQFTILFPSIQTS